MKFVQSAGRILKSMVFKGLKRAGFGAAAGALGGKMFGQNIIETTSIGILTGGINGAIDGLFDQLAVETGETVAKATGPEITPNQSVTKIQYALTLASFATPLLAKYILEQAGQNNVSVRMAFNTYYVGGLMIVAATVFLGCCTRCIPTQIVTSLLAPATIAKPINDGFQDDASTFSDNFKKEYNAKNPNNDDENKNQTDQLTITVSEPPRLT